MTNIKSGVDRGELIDHTTGPNQEKKTRKSPVPANTDRIKEGALRMDLIDRVNLRDQLIISIDNELKSMEEKFNAAKALVK
jgi:hypothetical protein